MHPHQSVSMLEQTASTASASLSPVLVADIANPRSLGAAGCLCYHMVGSVLELCWTEEGMCSFTAHILPTVTSTGSTMFCPAGLGHPVAAWPLTSLASPIHLRIDSYIPAEVLLSALTSVAPSLVSLVYYEEAIRDLAFAARLAAALIPSLPTLRRLRLVYNPPLELLPLDSSDSLSPFASPFYHLLPRFHQLVFVSMTCTRYLTLGAFRFLPPSLAHLRIEVLRPKTGLSIPAAVLAAFKDSKTPITGLKTLTVLDDDEKGWEEWENEIVKAAHERGLTFVRIGESEVDMAPDESVRGTVKL